LLVLALLAVLAGCAPGKQAARPDNPPGVAVRLPMVESPRVRLHAEEPRRPPPGPQSVGDEYFGRWLVLIEVDITPPEAERPPEAAEFK
jgi:hypothetical protein